MGKSHTCLEASILENTGVEPEEKDHAKGTEKETPEEEENQERKCSRSGQSFQKGGVVIKGRNSRGVCLSENSVDVVAIEEWGSCQKL